MGKRVRRNKDWFRIGLVILIVLFFIVLFLALVDLFELMSTARGGQNANDVAFHLSAFGGEWIPELTEVVVRDTSDTNVDTLVMIDSSMHLDTLYAILYNALGGTLGVSTWEVVVFDSAGDPVDTIQVTEDFADVWDANYWHDVFAIIVRNATDESLFTLTAWQDSSDLYYQKYGGDYTINVRDSLENILYSFAATIDSPDVYEVNHWEPHYSITVLDSIENIIYTISALQDSDNTYIRNWLGEAPAAMATGVPGTNDYCEIKGVVQGPEGTRIANAVVHFRLKSHFPVFWGDVLITQTNWKTTTDDTGGIEFSLLRNKDLSDTLSYYLVNVPRAGLRNAKAVIPKGLNSMPWQTIFTTQ